MIGFGRSGGLDQVATRLRRRGGPPAAYADLRRAGRPLPQDEAPAGAATIVSVTRSMTDPMTDADCPTTATIAGTAGAAGPARRPGLSAPGRAVAWAVALGRRRSRCRPHSVVTSPTAPPRRARTPSRPSACWRSGSRPSPASRTRWWCGPTTSRAYVGEVVRSSTSWDARPTWRPSKTPTPPRGHHPGRPDVGRPRVSRRRQPQRHAGRGDPALAGRGRGGRARRAGRRARWTGRAAGRGEPVRIPR